MCNISKLKGRMVEKGVTQDALAKAIDVDRSTMSRKMTGKASFTVGEAEKISLFLHLSKDDSVSIFLPTMSQ